MFSETPDMLFMSITSLSQFCPLLNLKGLNNLLIIKNTWSQLYDGNGFEDYIFNIKNDIFFLMFYYIKTGS